MARRKPAAKTEAPVVTEEKPEVVVEEITEVAVEEPTEVAASEEVETPVVEEQPEEVVVVKPTADVLTEGKDPATHHVLHTLGEYIDAMKPGVPQNDSTLQRNQLKLRVIINGLLSVSDELFADVMKSTVAIIREHRDGVFNERFVYRAFGSLRISREERQKLEAMINLLLVSADSKNPKVVSNVVDMDVVFSRIKNNDHQQKLESFFS